MKKIVLVDDYADYAETLKEFIERFNDAQCVTFSNPIDALLYVLENKDTVDILLTDYEMPQMNGFSLASKLLEEKVNIRIILSSGHSKQTLEKICKQYDLENKIELTTKGDLEILMHLA